MRYIIPVKAARAAVKPTPLVDVLRSLRDGRVIESFAIVGTDLQIEARPGLELAFMLEEETADPRLENGTFHIGALSSVDGGGSLGPVENREHRHSGHLNQEMSAAYYRRAESFLHTAAFRRLSRHRRAIWRLHSQGKSKYDIADELSCPSGTVARAILAIRPQAGLGRTARSIPRGPQKRRTS